MATLEDVAHLAGVSKSTASRALARPELVKADTIRRVRQAAETLAFEPSRIARALARGRTGLVAMVVPNLGNSFFAPIIEGAQSQAEEAGFQLTIAVRGLDSVDDQLAMERLSHQVDGFLLTAPQADEEVIRRVSALAPTVLVEREVANIPSVIVDTPTAFGRLARDLVARGHRRIAYIGGPTGSRPNQNRAEAIRQALVGQAELTVFGPYPPLAEYGFEVATDIVKSGCTAVLVYASPISLGLMFALSAQNVSVPQDIVVSGDESMAQAMGVTGIPTIDVDGAKVGRSAMHLLSGLFDGTPSDSPQQIRLSVPVHWS